MTPRSQSSPVPARPWLKLASLAAVLALLVTAPALADDAAPATLQAVEPHLVCMVNNTFFAKPQIPVEVEGKTYFGCCEMCKERLANDAAARQATDPQSGKQVDKAKAVIGALPSGAVLYFETKANLEAYRAKLERP